MRSAAPGPRGRAADERGFTLVELLIASLVTVIVLSGAVALTSQVQNAYRRQMEEAAAVQEGRNALDWIGKYVRGAGNNPYVVVTTNCPAAGTVFSAIRIDPDGDGVDDDIRLMTDSNPVDGKIGGPDSASCTQANEDVTIRLNQQQHMITVTDNNLGTLISRTDSVVSALNFEYRDASHNVTADELQAVYVKVLLTVRTRTLDPATGAPVSRTLESEVRVRSR